MKASRNTSDATPGANAVSRNAENSKEPVMPAMVKKAIMMSKKPT